LFRPSPSSTTGDHEPASVWAIIGFPKQCVRGIPAGSTRRAPAQRQRALPESWYLHQDGRRIKDHVYHLFVMDPRSRGWQQHVAQKCARLCFLDGMGTSSVGRTTPHLRWTTAQWVSRAALVVRAVARTGKHVLPNSVGVGVWQLIAAAGGQGSTEAFNTRNAHASLAAGRIWVAEIGGCFAKYHAFLHWRGRGDHFACYEHGHLPWDTGWLR
jgi:hypothetical protein